MITEMNLRFKYRCAESNLVAEFTCVTFAFERSVDLSSFARIGDAGLEPRICS